MQLLLSRLGGGGGGGGLGWDPPEILAIPVHVYTLSIRLPVHHWSSLSMKAWCYGYMCAMVT